MSALSIFRSECSQVRQPRRVLEDGSGILMEHAVHVTVLPGQQPFQEANVATPSCDEQSHRGRLLGSLQGEGWEGVGEVRKLPGNETPGSSLATTPCGSVAVRSRPRYSHSPWTGEKGSSAALRQRTGVWMASTLVLGLAAW